MPLLIRLGCKMGRSGLKHEKASQAALEYLIIYGAAILIVAVAMVLLYYLTSPTTSVPNSCQFASGSPTCIDAIIGTNSVTSNTAVVLFLSNSGTYPVTSPNAIVQIGASNSSRYGTVCEPNYVKPGGAILCVVNLTQKTGLNQLVTGKIYLASNYCISSTSRACTNAQREIYVGSFSGHTQAVSGYNTSISLDAESNVLPPDGQEDLLTAQVRLLGQNIGFATINFTSNSTVPILGSQICGPGSPPNPCSAFSNSDPQGTAESNVWSYDNAVVKIFANFSGASANVVIVFGNAITALSRTCHIPGPIKDYIVTNANYSKENPITATGATGTYVIEKITSSPLTLNGNGNSALNCFAVDSTVGKGLVTLNMGGNSEDNIVNLIGDASVSIGEAGNTGILLLTDSGNGAISGTVSGNQNLFKMSSGTGNIMLTVSGNSQSVANITTASTNVIFTLSGNSQDVNITTTAPSANVVASVTGNSQLMNIVVAAGTTIIVPIAEGNSNVFNSIGGTLIIHTFTGNTNTFNPVNEVVYLVTPCTGNGNKIVIGSGSNALDSPYQCS